MTSHPRALHLAPIMPARTGNGLAMRQGMFLEALSRTFETDLVVLPVAGRADAKPELADELGVRTAVVPVAGRQDTHFSLLARLADPVARLPAFRSYGRSSLASHVSRAVLDDVLEVVRRDGYDLVHVGRSYLLDARSVAPAATVTADLDEDEWTSYRELAATLRAADAPAAAWADAEADAIAALIGRASGVARWFISSDADARWVSERHSGHAPEVVGNAVVIPDHAARNDDGATLMFLGAFGYAPNVDAARWLVNDVWPIIRARAGRPLRLMLVGRDAGRVADLADHPSVELRGEVAEVRDAFAATTLFVAPLRAGAGTRLKLLEAAAHLVPIVTTSLGARGLPLVDGEHLLIADDAAGLADAVLRALDDPGAADRRAAAAHMLVSRLFDRARAVEHLACRLRDIAAT